MLAFVTTSERGQSDRLLAAIADRLQNSGIVLSGVVQVNTETAPDRHCQMDLRVLTDGTLIRISQNLGPFASGCRLDTSALAEAVGRVEATLQAHRPQLLILNKFGKQEAEGHGFRPIIAQALLQGIPVLTSVAEKNRAGFERFAEGIATLLPEDEDAVEAWCRMQFNPVIALSDG